MHKALQQVLARDDVQAKLAAAGAIANLSAPEELSKLIASEIKTFRDVASRAGLEAK